MTLITFVQVFTVCLLGAMSPGPSMAVVINNAIFKGRYNGILTSIGHGIGIAVYATFAVLGLGLIIETNIFIFNGLKILSIIFLIFIGVKSILNKEKFSFEKKDIKKNLTIVKNKISKKAKDIFLVHQTHSNKFVFIDKNYKFSKKKIKADAIITDQKKYQLLF